MVHFSHLLTTYSWLVKIILLVVLGLAISLVELILYRRLLPVAIQKNRLWTQAILKSLHHPLQIYIWVIVVSFIISIVGNLFAFDEEFLVAMSFLRRFLTVVFVLWFGMRAIRNFENAMVNRTKAGVSKINDETSVHAIAQLSRVVLIFIVILMILQTVGIKMSALLALGGVGGAVIGFAAKDSLANFIGGMMIYWDRPFSVGDWVRSPDREIEGTVENIGWRLTRIRTFDTRPLYVPNGIISNISVENVSRMINRRIKVSLGVRYDDAKQVATIAQEIKTMLQAREDIDKKQTLYVNLTELGATSLNILIYAFTKTVDQIKFQATLQDILLKVMAIVAAHGAQCAFPTQTLDIPEGASITVKTEKESTNA